MNTQYLDRSEGRIAFDVTGAGPLVICVPSMGDIRGEYRFLAPQLVEAGYSVATMDVRGHGESSAHWRDYSVAGVGSDLVALTRHLAAGPTVFVGDSMAGGAAVWAAAEAPDAVASLVLIDPFVRSFPGLMETLMGGLYRLLFADPWGPNLWLRYYTTLYPSRPPADFDAYRMELRANLAEPGRMHALRQMLLASKAASEAHLPRVKARTLVIMGTRDPDFKDPAAEARWVGEQLHAEVHMIEGAGHYPHAEMPAETAPVILSFLNAMTESER